MCQNSSLVSCKMLLVRPGMSESEQPIGIEIMDMCYSDRQRHGRKHIEDLEIPSLAMRDILQGNEFITRIDCGSYTY